MVSPCGERNAARTARRSAGTEPAIARHDFPRARPGNPDDRHAGRRLAARQRKDGVGELHLGPALACRRSGATSVVGHPASTLFRDPLRRSPDRQRSALHGAMSDRNDYRMQHSKNEWRPVHRVRSLLEPGTVSRPNEPVRWHGCTDAERHSDSPRQEPNGTCRATGRSVMAVIAKSVATDRLDAATCHVRFVSESIDRRAVAGPLQPWVGSNYLEAPLATAGFSPSNRCFAAERQHVRTRWCVAARAQVFIESKKSPLVLVCFSLSMRNSMASIVPIGARMRRSTKIFCRSCLATSRSSLRVPDFRMSMAG